MTESARLAPGVPGRGGARPTVPQPHLRFSFRFLLIVGIQARKLSKVKSSPAATPTNGKRGAGAGNSPASGKRPGAGGGIDTLSMVPEEASTRPRAGRGGAEAAAAAGEDVAGGDSGVERDSRGSRQGLEEEGTTAAAGVATAGAAPFGCPAPPGRRRLHRRNGGSEAGPGRRVAGCRRSRGAFTITKCRGPCACLQCNKWR